MYTSTSIFGRVPFFAFPLALAGVACTQQAAEPPAETTSSVSEAVVCSVNNPKPGCVIGGGGNRCGLLGGTCCPPPPSDPSAGGSCLASYATCDGGSFKCVACGSAGQVPCPGDVCFNGSDVNGLCVDCGSISNANVSMVAAGPNQVNVSFNSSAAFSTSVSLVNATNLSDRHEVFGPSATSSNVAVTGLSPSTTYEVVLTPGACGALPQTATQNAVFDGGLFDLTLQQSGFKASNVALGTGGNGQAQAVFEASPALVALRPSLGSSPLAFNLPSPTFVTPSPLPNYTATFTALSAAMSNVTVNFNVNDVEFAVPFTATLHLHTSGATPDADLNIDSGLLDIELGFSPLTQTFFVSAVAADIQDHVSNCGIGGWCNGLFDSNLPNLDALVSQAIQGPLATAVSDPSVTTVVEQVFAQVLTSLRGSKAAPFSVQPGSMYYTTSYGVSEFAFNIQDISNSIGTVTTSAN